MKTARIVIAVLTLAFPIAIVFGFCTLNPAPVHAQALRLVHPPRDCNLAEYRDDQLIPGKSLSLRRYEWHALMAGLSTAAAEGIHRATRLPRWASAVTATVAIGLLPHVRGGLIRREYPIDLADWGFDLFDRSAPLILWTGASGNTWQSRTLAVTTFVGGYASLACWSSP